MGSSFMALDPWFNRRYPLEYLKKWLYWPIQYQVLHDAEAVFFTTNEERDLARPSFSHARSIEPPAKTLGKLIELLPIQ